MKTKTSTLLGAISLLLVSQSSWVYAEPQGRRGPPPEAYTACEGKNAGDTAQFENRRGETVSGTCENHNGILVLRPEGKQTSNNKRGRRVPPPEAYTACEGKSAGDTAQFENQRGETVSGICQEDNGKLALRPNRPQRQQR